MTTVPRGGCHLSCEVPAFDSLAFGVVCEPFAGDGVPYAVDVCLGARLGEPRALLLVQVEDESAVGHPVYQVVASVRLRVPWASHGRQFTKNSVTPPLLLHQSCLPLGFPVFGHGRTGAHRLGVLPTVSLWHGHNYSTTHLWGLSLSANNCTNDTLQAFNLFLHNTGRRDHQSYVTSWHSRRKFHVHMPYIVSRRKHRFT